MSKLSVEEQQALDRLMGTLRMGLPASQSKELENAFEDMKSSGIPMEFREVMDSMKNKPLDLATAAKLVRMTGKLARQQVEKKIARDEAGESGSKTSGSSGTSSSGGQKKKKNAGGSTNFKDFKENLDAQN